MDTKQYWDEIYEHKKLADFSWFQEYPKTSMEFLQVLNLPKDANIIDIGGGDGFFIDALLALGYQHIYILDISSKAIERAKTRLGANAQKVNWIVADVTEFDPPVRFDFWHDRATFHFLTEEEKINKYVQLAETAIVKDGFLVLGTFAEDGPEKCSGLDIKQYSALSMSSRFEKKFERIKCVEEDHITPQQKKQHFVFCSFKKKRTGIPVKK